jgi:hypothetical protein
LDYEIINPQIDIYIEKEYENDFLHLNKKYEICTLDMKDMNILDLKFKLDKIRYHSLSRYDIAVDTQCSFKTALTTYLLSGRTAGYKVSGLIGYITSLFYDEKIDINDNNSAENIKRLLSVPFGFTA